MAQGFLWETFHNWCSQWTGIFSLYILFSCPYGMNPSITISRQKFRLWCWNMEIRHLVFRALWCGKCEKSILEDTGSVMTSIWNWCSSINSGIFSNRHSDSIWKDGQQLSRFASYTGQIRFSVTVEYIKCVCICVTVGAGLSFQCLIVEKLWK